MPVAAIMDFAGGDAAAYDRVIERMGLDGTLAPGAIFHAAGPYEGGWRVIDVWEDRAAFGEFAETQIGPHAGAEGFPEPALELVDVEESFDQREAGTITHLQVVRLSGVTREQFHDADADIRDDREPPDGCLFHVNGPTGDGWIVIDAWTDKETRDAFVAAKIAPAMQSRAMAPPTIEDLAVHNTLAPA